jgi:hypothetical protein
MRTKWIALGVLLALGGCATTSPKYVKAGASEEDYQRTLAGCRVKAAMVPSSCDNMRGILMAATLKNCMRAEGWIEEK